MIFELQRIRALALVRMGFPHSVEEQLERVVADANSQYWMDEELSAMVALAELRRCQGRREAAKLLLQDAKELADRGQYRLHQADIANTFARLARDENEASNLAIAATDAYRLSWCDGPPFAYEWGLAEAARHLEACGANPPDGLAAFDASKHEAMPAVDINPADEWHLDEEKYGTALIDGFGSEAPEPAE